MTAIEIRHAGAESEPEPEPEPADLDQALDEAFGPVARWWVGELPGLGVIRLPLP